MAGAISTIIKNDAVVVTDFNLEQAEAPKDFLLKHGNAVLIGITDGSGMFEYKSGSQVRHLPAARGRADWLEHGELRPGTSRGNFGRSMLVEVRNLPTPTISPRTFGDGIIFKNDFVCVYEELLGPNEIRKMHNHAPRFVVALTEVFIHHKYGSGKEVDGTNTPGGSAWIPTTTTHEVTNTGPRPYWAICVEHP